MAIDLSEFAKDKCIVADVESILESLDVSLRDVSFTPHSMVTASYFTLFYFFSRDILRILNVALTFSNKTLSTAWNSVCRFLDTSDRTASPTNKKIWNETLLCKKP
jgi:hypothetical protein